MTFTHFDFTWHGAATQMDDGGFTGLDALREHMAKYCVDGICQLERGEETGCYHIQGHGILEQAAATAARVASYNRNTIYSSMRISPTSTTVTDDFKHKRITLEQMYAAKEETRVQGPWRLKKEVKLTRRIPRQQREVSEESLFPWQKWLIEDAKKWDTRTINIVLNTSGNEGKSWLCQRMRLMYGLKAFQVTAAKDRERLEADMCSKLIKAECYDPNVVFCDLPKAMPKDNLAGIFAGLEQIKSGYLDDSRNEPKSWDYDCPNIYVFTNQWPDLNLLSNDRWVFHRIENHDIIEVSMEQVKDEIDRARQGSRKRPFEESGV